MKRFIFSILSVVCVCSVMNMGSAHAVDTESPCIVEGTCEPGTWNGHEFENCPNGPGECQCPTLNVPQEPGETFTCICTSDDQCQDGYCDKGACQPCKPYYGGGCSGTTRTKIDDCNYKDVTSTLDCRTGCTTSESYGCYTGDTDSIGTYECR